MNVTVLLCKMNDERISQNKLEIDIRKWPKVTFEKWTLSVDLTSITLERFQLVTCCIDMEHSNKGAKKLEIEKRVRLKMWDQEFNLETG